MFARILPAAIVMFVLSLSAFAEDKIENPLYKSWMHHKPGTTVVLSMDTVAAGFATEGEMIHKLLEIDGDKAIVETRTKMTVMGQTREGPPTKREILARVHREEANRVGMPEGSSGTVKEVGTENLEIAGATYECRVIEFTGEQQGNKTSGKTWLSEQVPGSLVKTNVNSEGQVAVKVNIELKSVDLK